MIVIFGGAFNPPTIAHYEVAKHVTNRPDVSELVFVPVGDHYEKAGLAPAFHRINMLEVVTKKLLNTSVSTIETDAPQPLKTIETLEKLQTFYPEKTLAFVMGADNLHDFSNWYDYQRLIKTFKILVVNRQNSDVKCFVEEKFPQEKGNFILMDDFVPLNVSSTQYRLDTTSSNLILPEVETYIKAHGLYKD